MTVDLPSLLSQAALLGKELGEESAAGLCHDARHDFRAVIQAVIVQQVKQRIHRPRFGVRGSVDDPWNSRLDDRPGAHRAGL